MLVTVMRYHSTFKRCLSFFLLQNLSPGPPPLQTDVEVCASPDAPIYLTSILGALLMNNLAEIFAKSSSSRKADIDQATAWAKKGLAVAQKARSEIVPDTTGKSKPKSTEDDPISICESVLAVLVYNLGMLSEVCGGDFAGDSSY